LVIWIANYSDRLGPSSKFVKISKKLICLEITGYGTKHIKASWLLELQMRGYRKVETQVNAINSNSRNSNCRYSPFSKKNPIIRISYISGCLVVPINTDKWSCDVLNTEKMTPTGGKNTVLGENPVQVPLRPKQNPHELVQD